MVVTHNPLGIESVDRGAEILSINGVSAAEIQKTLLPYVRADGSNDAKRRKLLDVQGVDGFETFDVFHSLLFPLATDKLQLNLRPYPGAALRTIEVTPIDRARSLKASPQKADSGSSDYWTLSKAAPHVALITMPGWALFDAKWDWKAKLDEMFETIDRDGSTGLIIDLRDNEGGMDCGFEILARLIDDPMPVGDDYNRLVRFRSTPEDLRAALDTWDRSFDHLGEGATEFGNGFLLIPKDEDDRRGIAPKGPRFRGKVVVLSSAQNSSATFQFIDLMQRKRLAKIYGEPTGGNQRGINGGCFFFLRLKNSGLEVDLPLIGQFPKVERPDASLTPDVFVSQTIEDIAAGKDTVLERAVKDLS